jgi:hypothetical protein
MKNNGWLLPIPNPGMYHQLVREKMDIFFVQQKGNKNLVLSR